MMKFLPSVSITQRHRIHVTLSYRQCAPPIACPNLDSGSRPKRLYIAILSARIVTAFRMNLQDHHFLRY